MRFFTFILKYGLGVLTLSLSVLFSFGHADEDAPAGEEVTVLAERFQFTPSEITVREGTTLQIDLRSEDTFHGFRIAAADLDVTIPARGRGTVTILFHANRKGRYAFECSRPCGAGHTLMRGVIVVE